MHGQQELQQDQVDITSTTQVASAASMRLDCIQPVSLLLLTLFHCSTFLACQPSAHDMSAKQ